MDVFTALDYQPITPSIWPFCTFHNIGIGIKISPAMSTIIEKYEKDGWFEVQSSFLYNSKSYRVNTWVKSVKRGNVDMFIAVILDTIEGETDRKECAVTKNGNYNNPIYEEKLEGKYSHKFTRGKRTYYLDLNF